MSERAGFPPAPEKSALANKDGTANLAWLAWFGAVANHARRVRVVVAAHDWASIPAGATAYADFTITNAALGDFAAASLDPTHADLAISAHVTAANSVRVWATNLSAGAIDLAAGTTRIRLEKAR